jgi:hypothetical protein
MVDIEQAESVKQAGYAGRQPLGEFHGAFSLGDKRSHHEEQGHHDQKDNGKPNGRKKRSEGCLDIRHVLNSFPRPRASTKPATLS